MTVGYSVPKFYACENHCLTVSVVIFLCW